MSKQTYKVGGTQKVLGHNPGETFAAELDPDHEARLLERGSITRVRSDAQTKPATKRVAPKSQE